MGHGIQPRSRSAGKNNSLHRAILMLLTTIEPSVSLSCPNKHIYLEFSLRAPAWNKRNPGGLWSVIQTSHKASHVDLKVLGKCFQEFRCVIAIDSHVVEVGILGY